MRSEPCEQIRAEMVAYTCDSCFFFQAEDGIRDPLVTGVQTCALPISGKLLLPLDQMIEGKQQLSRDLLEGGADLHLTELKDEELLRLVRLDLNSALKEN